MYSGVGDTTSLVPGFPIRTSSDPRSVDSSPRHNAASHVLHRLPVPRHPPCALKHLQHKTKSYIKLEIAHQHNKKAHPQKGNEPPCVLDARNHYPQIKHHTPPPKLGQQQPHSPTGERTPPARVDHLRFPNTQDEEMTGLLSQSPIVCLTVSITEKSSQRLNPVPVQRLSCTRPPPTTGERPSNESPGHTVESARCGPLQVSWCSLERR
jgi:hypothetical protein